MDTRTRHDELREKVIEFHKAHPQVWSLFVTFTNEKISHGFTHYSAKGVFERIRWETDQAENRSNEFKINNNFSSFYARAFMRRYPAHDGFFRTRQQISKKDGPVCMAELQPQDFD